MPCTDGGPSREQMEEARNIPAVLCGLLSVLEHAETMDAVLAGVDWAEVGVTRAWVEGWWMMHKERDRRRRQLEAEARERDRARAEAAAKLTPAERALLGIR